MNGAIRTKERCPNCEAPYGPSFECPIHKNHPTRFYVDVPWKGRRIRLYSNRKGEPLDSYRLALALHTEIDEEIKSHTFNPIKYLRQDQALFWTKTLLDRFLKAKIAAIAPAYRPDYRRMVDRATAFFEKKDAREIRKLDLINYQNDLASSQIRGKTQKNYLDLFKTFLRWLRSDLEVLDVIPPFPSVELAPRAPNWISQKDQVRILGEIPEEDRPIIEFLMLHGCRPAEARALRVRDVDLKNQTVTISSSWSGKEFREQRKGRGSRPVILPIHPEALDFLTRRLSGCLPGAFIFINPRTDNPYSAWALCGIWRRLRVKAEISSSVRLYDATRHSVATQLRLAGVPIADIKDQLGHTDIRTTMRYAHSDIGRLRANMDKLSVREIRPQTVPRGKTAENR